MDVPNTKTEKTDNTKRRAGRAGGPCFQFENMNCSGLEGCMEGRAGHQGGQTGCTKGRAAQQNGRRAAQQSGQAACNKGRAGGLH